MMLLVPSLARKCDGKAQVRQMQILGEEKWKEEGAQKIVVSQEKE